MITIKKLKAIKNVIINNEGATLKSNLKKASLKSGYMVSLPGIEKQLNINDLTIKTLKTYSKLARSKNGFVGFWLDNNILYIDISINIKDRFEALQKARQWKQKAIYNIKLNNCIYLNY